MTNDRPILVDEADGACVYCTEWAARKYGPGGARCCDQCGDEIPVYGNMQGNGFEGPHPHHYHLRPIHGGPTGRQGILMELCLECYIEHRQKYWPPTETGVYGKPHPTREEMLAHVPR